MPRSAVQLYTLRSLDDSIPELVRRVGETPIQGVEFAGLDGCTPEDVEVALEDAELDSAGAHVGFDELREDFDATVAPYQHIGCETVVVPAVNETYFVNEESVDELADELTTFAERANEAGMRLCYHNHAFEFTEFDDGTAFERLMSKTSDVVEFEFDVGLATFAGVDPRHYLKRYADRIALVHLTDTVTGDESRLHVNYGTGDVDLRGCVTATKDIDAGWVIYEHGLTNDPEAALAEASGELAELL